MKCCIFSEFIVLIFSVITYRFAACQNLQLGLNLGTSMIHWNYTADDKFSAPFFDDFSHSDSYIPKKIGGSFSMIFRDFTLRLSLSYGQAQSNIDNHTPNTTFSYTTQSGVEKTIQIEDLNYGIKTHVIGFSASTAFLFPFSMGRRRILSIYPGIGLGYYNYQFSGDWNVTNEEIDHNNISTIYSAKGDYEKASISGVAQCFIFGIDVKTSSRLHFFLEICKMGLGMLKQIRDLDYIDFEPNDTGTEYKKTIQKKIGELKRDFNTEAGILDIGFQFGVKMSL